VRLATANLIANVMGEDALVQFVPVKNKLLVALGTGSCLG
tara:strand:+ start:631 stop:750 length:120 start_codon:yes stop_codon:yes gene_type:complete